MGSGSAFFAGGKLKKVAVRGGEPVSLCNAPNPHGATWADRRIVFAPIVYAGLSEISEDGGTPRAVTALDLTERREGASLAGAPPGGPRGGLHGLDRGAPGGLEVVVQSLQTGNGGSSFEEHVGPLRSKRSPDLRAGRHADGRAIRPPAAGSHRRARDRGRGCAASSTGAVQFALSGLSWLLYVPGGVQGDERSLVRVDRQGRPFRCPQPPGPTSRRGSHRRRPRRRGDRGRQHRPVRSRPGRRSVDPPHLRGQQHLPRLDAGRQAGGVPVEPGGPPEPVLEAGRWQRPRERLTTGEHADNPSSWSPDGRLLAYHKVHPETGRDLWVVPTDGERQPRLFLASPANEGTPAFSPNGRWLAYTSDESGRSEIYVRPFPGPGGKWQVSTDGGTEPVWARSGRELFFRSGDRMMAAPIAGDREFSRRQARASVRGSLREALRPSQLRRHPGRPVLRDGQGSRAGVERLAAERPARVGRGLEAPTRAQ